MSLTELVELRRGGALAFALMPIFATSIVFYHGRHRGTSKRWYALQINSE